MNRRKALMTLFSLPVAASGAGKSSAQPKLVTVTNTVVIDGRDMKKWIEESMVAAIENNERGIRSHLRDALGIQK